MKTFTNTVSTIKRAHHVIDATDQTLGRLSVQIAKLLMGKNKPQFSGHIDCGDNVVIINAANIGVTGNKLEAKKYYRHSSYPGGIKETGLAELMATSPASVLERAIGGMLPKNRLHDDRMRRLKVYAGAEHPHAGQAPKTLGAK